jgi:hypothetical protein
VQYVLRKGISKTEQITLAGWLVNWKHALTGHCKTDIQRARKVGSSKLLIVYVFGKIATAFIYFIF